MKIAPALRDAGRKLLRVLADDFEMFGGDAVGERQRVGELLRRRSIAP